MPRTTRRPRVALIRASQINRKIFLIRGHKVMLDRDLAELYDVSTTALNQAVRRNSSRFPDDFMFQLSREELQNWISQIVTSNSPLKMGLRKRPLAFTEHGVVMLSSVLRSQRAALVNIQIVRAFVRLREILSEHADLSRRIDALEKKYDRRFVVVFDAIRQLVVPLDQVRRRRIGFRTD